MSTPLSPKPTGLVERILRQGYQLCARCGQIIRAGEIALSASRSNDWHMYIHTECPSRRRGLGLPGRLAIVRAEAMRELANDEQPEKVTLDWWAKLLNAPGHKGRWYTAETKGQALPWELNGITFPAVSNMDWAHIDAELMLVDYSWADESTVTDRLGRDLAKILETHEPYDKSRGRHQAFVHHSDDDDGHRISRAVLRRNYVEDAVIHSLDLDKWTPLLQRALQNAVQYSCPSLQYTASYRVFCGGTEGQGASGQVPGGRDEYSQPSPIRLAVFSHPTMRGPLELPESVVREMRGQYHPPTPTGTIFSLPSPRREVRCTPISWKLKDEVDDNWNWGEALWSDAKVYNIDGVMMDEFEVMLPQLLRKERSFALPKGRPRAVRPTQWELPTNRWRQKWQEEYVERLEHAANDLQFGYSQPFDVAATREGLHDPPPSLPWNCHTDPHKYVQVAGGEEPVYQLKPEYIRVLNDLGAKQAVSPQKHIWEGEEYLSTAPIAEALAAPAL